MQRSASPHLVRLLGAFLATAVGMGLLSAGLVMPLAGATGNAARGTVQAFEDLDDEFTAVSLAQQSKIYSADGKLLATPYDANRIIVPMSKISKNMVNAQLAIEDSRFYEHGGIDLRGTSRAFFSNLSSGATQGGSSITQQYVKIMLQEKAVREDDQEAANAATEQTYSRKLQEMKYALNVEKTHTKNQILNGYLNIVYYGDQAYGVEAAARHFFSKPAKRLSVNEAATLAGVVQSPGVLNIRTNTAAVQKRRDLVLDRMYSLGMISEKANKRLKKQSVKSLLHIKKNEGGTCSKAADPYFCNYVIEYLKTMPELGPDPDARMQAVNTGGLTIKTTLRRDWQKQMHEYLTARVPNGDPSGVGAASAMIEPGTGKVRAIAQTSQYKIGLKQASTQYSEQAWTYPTRYGGTNGFAIGSTAKMYALVAALRKGKPVNSSVNAPVAGPKDPAYFAPSQFESRCTTSVPWPVQNDYAGDGGRLSLREATARSINTAFAQLASDIGSCNIPKQMSAMGLTDGNGETYGLTRSEETGKKIKGDYSIANIVLGSDSTSPLQLASSYATLAADGKYCPPTPIESITRANSKKPMKISQPACKQVLDKDVARGVTNLLRAPITQGTATAAQLADGRVAAGKTGTTDQHRQSWFVGYTPQLATAVWVGTPITEKRMDGVCIGGQCVGQVFGGTIAAPLWKKIMDDASQGMDLESFKEPSQDVLYGNDETTNAPVAPVAPSAPVVQQTTVPVAPPVQQPAPARTQAPARTSATATRTAAPKASGGAAPTSAPKATQPRATATPTKTKTKTKTTATKAPAGPKATATATKSD